MSSPPPPPPLPQVGLDPMEEFLVREKAALEALENVDIANSEAMLIDELPVVSHSGRPTPVSGNSRGSVPSITSSPAPQASRMSLPNFNETTDNSGGGSLTKADGVMGATSTFTPPIISGGNPSTTPFSPPTSSNRGSRVETGAIKEWKEARSQRIAERDAAAEQSRQDRKQKAKVDLENFQVSWRNSVENRKATNRAKDATSNVKSPWDDEPPAQKPLSKEQIDWNSVNSLFEALPKPAKDTSRLASIVKSLAH